MATAARRLHANLNWAAGIAAVALMAAQAQPARAQDITIGEGIAIGWGQFFVADERKLWEQEGLNPKIIQFASGRLVLEAVAGGHVTVGTAAETPVMFAAVNNLPIRVIGTLNRYEPFELAAVKDIKTIQDIKGRKIGYSQGTNAHYYLHKLLDRAGLKLSDVTPVSLNPGDFVASLTNGAIDAFIWTEPHLSQALAQGGGKVHRIATPGLYSTFSSIITHQKVVDETPELLVKALRALIAADRVARDNPDEAVGYAATRVKLDPQIAKQVWPTLNLAIDLDREALTRELESQAKWAIANNLVRPDARLPDFNAVLVSKPLETARGQLKAAQK
ncbi:hypothetical protein TSO221_25290 [Azospirillum sp. TSO22-1]|nr:hypothetical protein TSO221_25290 [Azospirillum sp. TSO22-1]